MSHSGVTHALNLSSGKQMHAFAKLDRFGNKTKRDINRSCYEVTQHFGVQKSSNTGRGFGSSLPNRFSYYEGKSKPIEKAQAPSPDKYVIKGQFGQDKIGGANTLYGKNQARSFGVGREEMLKLHIQDVEAGRLNPSQNPSPGAYEATEGFGKLGMNKTFSAKLPYDEIFWRRQKKLPGPASYKYAEVLGQSIVTSTKHNSVGQKLPQA